MPRSLMNPLTVLAFPGVYIAYKINEFKKQCQEKSKEKITERELLFLRQKIGKLMSKLENAHLELATCREEECVICISSRATMQTFPCGHRVVCQRCFMRTIQSAVVQRRLPLRCVVCRAKILRLKHCNRDRIPPQPRPAWMGPAFEIPEVSRRSQGDRLVEIRDDYPSQVIGTQRPPCLLHKHKPSRPSVTPKRVLEAVRHAEADDVRDPITHSAHRQRRVRSRRHRRHGGHVSPALCPIPEKEEFEFSETSGRMNAGERKDSPKLVTDQRHSTEKNSSRKKGMSLFGSFPFHILNRSPLKILKEKYRHLV